jgi:hypothetical protein
MEAQPNPLSAMELIAKVPVIMVSGRKVFCDGGLYNHNARTWRFRPPKSVHQFGW